MQCEGGVMDIVEKSPTQLLREEIERRILESAAKRLEQQQGNSTYMQAWARAARIIRAMKPG